MKDLIHLVLVSSRNSHSSWPGGQPQSPLRRRAVQARAKEPRGLPDPYTSPSNSLLADRSAVFSAYTPCVPARIPHHIPRHIGGTSVHFEIGDYYTCQQVWLRGFLRSQSAQVQHRHSSLTGRQCQA